MKLNFKSLTLLLAFSSTFAIGQTLDNFHLSLVNQVSQSSLVNNLTDFVGFGEKRMGSTAQTNAKNWIASQYQALGYTNIEFQNVNVFGQIGQNIIVTKTGTTYPNQYIVIDGHYDTINGPGANDNGSGTAIILEIAKILKNIPTEYSIKFIHFTGEEMGLHGSIQYVENIAVPQNLDIKLVLNIDQVGGVVGETNNRITCERDEDWPSSNNQQSSIATNQLATLMELYSNLSTNISHAYGSDYIPFQEAGYVITGLYEFNESPYPHSPMDTMANVDTNFIYEVAKGALGAMCFFAKAYNDMSVQDSGKSSFQVYPNPANDKLFVENNTLENSKYFLTDISGKLVSKGEISSKINTIYTSELPNGVYILKLENKTENFSQKILINHH